MVADNVRKRFEDKFYITPGCWIWTGSRNADGYGHFRYGEIVKAHRFSYEMYVGEIPRGLLIRHRCANPSCVNPEHLVPGTYKENMDDRDFHQNTARGERNGKTKMTDADVIRAKELLKQGYLRETVAEMLGVSGRTIWYSIKTRKL